MKSGCAVSENAQFYTYELRQIDAWGNAEEGWTYNNSFHTKTVRVEDGQEEEFLLDIMTLEARENYMVNTDFDGTFELCNGLTGEPLFGLFPIN